MSDLRAAQLHRHELRRARRHRNLRLAVAYTVSRGTYQGPRRAEKMAIDHVCPRKP